MARKTVLDFSPAGGSLRQRRHRRKEARQHIDEFNDVIKQEERRRAILDREAWKDSLQVPRGGRPGPAELRMFRKLTYQPYRSTSTTTRALFPFVAQRGLGYRGIYMGMDLHTRTSFSFDPWQLYLDGVIKNPNGMIAGTVGMGKSTVGKALVLRGGAYGQKWYQPADLKGEWADLARAVNGFVVALTKGGLPRLNILDPGNRPERTLDGTWIDQATWEAMVATRRQNVIETVIEAISGRKLTNEEVSALSIGLDTMARSHDTPVLSHLITALKYPTMNADTDGFDSQEHMRRAGQAAYFALEQLTGRGKLAGLFDAPSTVQFDATLPAGVIDISGMSSESDELAITKICTASWMEAALRDPQAGHRWIIHDEFWKDATDIPTLERANESNKMSRHLGVSNWYIMHRISDVDAGGDSDSRARALARGLMADTETRIFFNQKSDQLEATRSFLGLNDMEIAYISQLRHGQALWQVGGRSFLVKNVLSPWESELFNTDSAMAGEQA